MGGLHVQPLRSPVCVNVVCVRFVADARARRLCAADCDQRDFRRTIHSQREPAPDSGGDEKMRVAIVIVPSAQDARCCRPRFRSQLGKKRELSAMSMSRECQWNLASHGFTERLWVVGEQKVRDKSITDDRLNFARIPLECPRPIDATDAQPTTRCEGRATQGRQSRLTGKS